MSDTGILIANKYGVIVHFLSKDGSLTCFPLRSGPQDANHPIINIALTNRCHYVKVDLQEGHSLANVSWHWNMHKLAHFETDQVFTTRENLKEWVDNVARNLGVVFEDDINSISEALNYYETPAIQKYWMIMPDTDGSSTCFPLRSGPQDANHPIINIALTNRCHYVKVDLQEGHPLANVSWQWNMHKSAHGSSTCFPLRSGPQDANHPIINIALTNRCHYVKVDLQEGHPLANVSWQWNMHKSARSIGWQTLYQARLNTYVPPYRLTNRHTTIYNISDQTPS
ncbi:hypothetical protein LXL04_023371 [Taraxacum kok-saghyz]